MDWLTAWFLWFANSFGLPAIFVASAIASATIVIPTPFNAVVFIIAPFYDPFVLTLVTAIGTTLGELSAYALGMGGEAALTRFKKKSQKEIDKIKNVFEKYGFWAVVIFALTPLPLDVVGVLAGMTRYNIKKFFVGTFIGKLGQYAIIVYGGYYGLPIVMQAFGLS